MTTLRSTLKATCLGLAVTAVVAACGGRSAPQGGDQDMVVGSDRGAKGDATTVCSGLSQTACERNPECGFFPGCANCNGPADPGLCLPKDQGFACPAIGCISCESITSQAQCTSTPGCQAQTCPDCTTGQTSQFIACAQKGASPIPCICAPSSCQQFTDPRAVPPRRGRAASPFSAWAATT